MVSFYASVVVNAPSQNNREAVQEDTHPLSFDLLSTQILPLAHRNVPCLRYPHLIEQLLLVLVLPLSRCSSTRHHRIHGSVTPFVGWDVLLAALGA